MFWDYIAVCLTSAFEFNLFVSCLCEALVVARVCMYSMCSCQSGLKLHNPMICLTSHIVWAGLEISGKALHLVCTNAAMEKNLLSFSLWKQHCAQVSFVMFPWKWIVFHWPFGSETVSAHKRKAWERYSYHKDAVIFEFRQIVLWKKREKNTSEEMKWKEFKRKEIISFLWLVSLCLCICIFLSLVPLPFLCQPSNLLHALLCFWSHPLPKYPKSPPRSNRHQNIILCAVRAPPCMYCEVWALYRLASCDPGSIFLIGVQDAWC